MLYMPLFDYGDVVYGHCCAITLKRLKAHQHRESV